MRIVPRAPARIGRREVLFGTSAAAVWLVTGCSGGSTDTPGGIDISSGTYHLNLVAYAVPKIGFDKIIPAFRQTKAGREIGFSQSYGPSGDQSRKVARHVPTDIVNFSVEPDISRLVKAGLVDEDWKKRNEYNSTPFGSVVSLVVREGNPLNIKDWPDLLGTRPDGKPIEIITPDPASSGSAKWNLLAPYAYAAFGSVETEEGKLVLDPAFTPEQVSEAIKGGHAAGLEFLTQLISEHIKVRPASGRSATQTFESGQGDVLLSYENEAIFLSEEQHAPIEFITPPLTFKIENPVAVVNTSENLPQAYEFLDFLFTTEAQQLWAAAGFRPVVKSVIQATKDRFPATEKVWTIKELGEALKTVDPAGEDAKGGWSTIDTVLFDKSKGEITKIFKAASSS